MLTQTKEDSSLAEICCAFSGAGSWQRGWSRVCIGELNGPFQPAVREEKWEGAKTRAEERINTMCKQ